MPKHLSLPPKQNSKFPFPWWAELLVFAFTYFLLVRFTMWVAHGPEKFITFWLPIGYLLALLIRNPLSRWPIFLFGLLSVNLISGFFIQGYPLFRILIFWVVDFLGAALGAFLFRLTFLEHTRISNVPRLLGLLLFCCLPGPMLTECFGTLWSGFSPNTWSFWKTWFDWLTSDITGMLLLTPPLLNLSASADRRLIKQIKPLRVVESIGFLSLMALTSQWVFGINESLPMAFLIFAAIIWPGLRFGVRGVSLAVLIAAIIATKNTAEGMGLLGHSDLDYWTQINILKVFIITLSISGYVIAITVKEKAKALDSLKDLNFNLENLVQKRTIDLLDEKQKFQNAFEDSPIGMALLSTDGFIIETNLSLSKLLGYEKNELINHTFHHFLHANDLADDRKSLEDLLKNEKGFFQKERKYIRKNGEVISAQVTASSSRPSPGKSRLIFVQVLDITQVKQSQEKLRESQERLALAVEQGKVGFWDYNLREGSLFWSPIVREIFAPDYQTVVPSLDFFLSRIHPEDLNGFKKLLEDHLENTTSRFQAQYRLKNWKGEWVWALSSGKVTERDNDEKPLRMMGTLTDITLVRNLEQSLAASEIRFQTLADKAPIGIFMAYADGETIYVNEELCNIIGRPKEEILGFGWANYLDSENDSNAIEKWQKSSSRNSEFTHESQFRRPGGQIVHVITHVNPVNSEGSQRNKFVGTLTDITERKLAETALLNLNKDLEKRVEERTLQLSRANDELAKAAQHKDEFLASMSHELRTPLNGVLGITDAINEGVYGPVNPEQVQALGDIEKSGRHLLALINDILDLAKLEAGKVELEIAPVPVSDICQASFSLVKQSLHSKQLHFHMDLEKAPEMILVDHRKMKQMLINLLSNSIKFTPEKGHIGLEVVGDEQKGEIQFTVWDTGIGIPEDKIGKLFKPFQQIDSSLSRKYTGSGLGLALIRRMAELHGGSVHVKSQPDKGSRFSITLPWDRAKIEQILGSDSQEDPHQFTKSASSPGKHPADTGPESVTDQNLPLILLAEDNEINAKTFEDYLKMNGFRVERAVDGFQALEFALKSAPDLILMDIQMPGMDGLEVTRKLKSMAATRNIPILAVTALAFKSDQEKCLEAGVNEYLTKPITLKSLKSYIEKWLQKTKREI